MNPHVLEAMSHGDKNLKSTQIENSSRRSFLKVASIATGGLAIGISLPSLAGNEITTDNGDFNPNGYIHLYENGDLVLYCGRCEMGQGISTALPGAVDDEMHAD